MWFFKVGDKTAVKAIDSSVKNRVSWKWPDERLEQSLGNIGPIKYKIGDCILKNTFVALHAVGLCGVKTKSLLQKMAKKTLICFTDNHLERLKLRIKYYQIGGVGPLNQYQKLEKQQIIWRFFICYP